MEYRHGRAVLESTSVKVRQCRGHNVVQTPALVMPPTSKKLEGHIASGTFVRASVRPCVRP